MESHNTLSSKKNDKIVWFFIISTIVHLIFAIILSKQKPQKSQKSNPVKPIFINIIDNLPSSKSTNLPEVSPSDISEPVKSVSDNITSSPKLPVYKEKTIEPIRKTPQSKAITIIPNKKPTVQVKKKKTEKILPKTDNILSRRERVQQLRAKSYKKLKNKQVNPKNKQNKNQLPFFGKKEQQIISKNFTVYNKAKKELKDHISINTADLMFTSYMRKLKSKINMAWHYPPRAAAMRWNGDVIVSIILNKKGEVNLVKIVDSSGYKILDDEVVSAIKKAGPFDKFPKGWKLDNIGISKKIFQNKEQISQLIKAEIIFTDGFNDDFFVFNDNLNSEDVLRGKIMEAKITNIEKIEKIVSIWNNYGRLLAIQGRFSYKNSNMFVY